MEEQKPQEEIKVERGELVMYQIFDCAEEIDLTRAEKVLQEKRSKARLEQVPPDDMVFPNPPLCYLLGTHTISTSQLEYTATLEAHIFHTGNVSISAWLPIPNGMPVRVGAAPAPPAAPAAAQQGRS